MKRMMVKTQPIQAKGHSLSLGPPYVNLRSLKLLLDSTDNRQKSIKTFEKHKCETNSIQKQNISTQPYCIDTPSGFMLEGCQARRLVHMARKWVALVASIRLRGQVSNQTVILCSQIHVAAQAYHHAYCKLQEKQSMCYIPTQ